jgi:hypothetical protein
MSVVPRFERCKPWCETSTVVTAVIIGKRDSVTETNREKLKTSLDLTFIDDGDETTGLQRMM